MIGHISEVDKASIESAVEKKSVDKFKVIGIGGLAALGMVPFNQANAANIGMNVVELDRNREPIEIRTDKLFDRPFAEQVQEKLENQRSYNVCEIDDPITFAFETASDLKHYKEILRINEEAGIDTAECDPNQNGHLCADYLKDAMDLAQAQMCGVPQQQFEQFEQQVAVNDEFAEAPDESTEYDDIYVDSSVLFKEDGVAKGMTAPLTALIDDSMTATELAGSQLNSEQREAAQDAYEETLLHSAAYQAYSSQVRLPNHSKPKKAQAGR